ncbi:hypothetical protein CSHISOI_09972 [Colletotrichum shisoi]|uniref:Uncharacterized protein n=1 Tax=Colletotrichum shisoi TaxID=2078593 RepID=A0A5Q4BFB0_9PEZI|nr:hypothetical protein CSHISOI_09972 [Colletotrichum shisoi]
MTNKHATSVCIDVDAAPVVVAGYKYRSL